MQTDKVSILGCGWLGVPLAKYLLEKGLSVKGSVTTIEKIGLLSNAGISPYLIVLSDTEVIVDDPDFFKCDVLVISIPPKRIEGIEQFFPSQIRRLIPFILKSYIQKVIFISSTSVYPEQNQVAIEDDLFVPDKASGRALVEAENLLKEQSGFKTTIVRFGGLIGADRNPARFLLKSAQPIANAPVNLIHQNDCIGIVSAIMEQECWGETLNACCPEHPMKKDFYERAAFISGLPAPVFSEELTSFKTIDSSKLIGLLNYQFIYPSPMDYLNSLMSSKN